MKFENTRVYNFQGALRGMRNPKNSWDKSDSSFGSFNLTYCDQAMNVAAKWVLSEHPEYKTSIKQEFAQQQDLYDKYANKLINNGILYKNPDEDTVEIAFIGPKDMKLAQALINAGSEHRKFLRQIFVTVDITAPIYWWKEMSTYKVGTVANSTSTMHKLASTPITLDCFEIDDLNEWLELNGQPLNYGFENILKYCEDLRKKYIETNDKRYWKELIRWLPQGWLQTRTWTANYEVLYNIVLQRGYHKLETEWGNGFIHWCTSLPYAKDLIFYGEKREKIYNLYAQK